MFARPGSLDAVEPVETRLATETERIKRAGVRWRILALAVAVVLAHGLGRPGGDLESRADVSLAQARVALRARPEWADLRLEARGFDVTLSGWAGASEQRVEAVQVVRGLLPAGRERFRETVEIWRTAWLRVEKSGKRVRMWGELPDTLGWRALAEGTIPGWDGGAEQPEERIWFQRGVEEPVWARGLPLFLGVFLERVEEGTCEASGREVTLRGSFAREGLRHEVLAEAGKLWGQGSDVLVVDRCSILPQTAAEFRLLRQEEGNWEVAGVLPDYGAGEQLSGILGPQCGKADLRVAANVAEEPWMEAGVEAIASFASGLQGKGSLLVTPGAIQMEGVVADAAAREAIERQFVAPVWGGRQVVNLLRAAPVRPAARPLWLEMGHAGKEFQVRGAVTREEQREELMKALQGGGGRVTDGLVVGGQAVAEPAWWPALVRLIELFVQDSEEGSIQVAGEMIQISGRLKDSSRREEFLRHASQLPGLPEFELRLASSAAPAVVIPGGRTGGKGK